MPLSLLAAFLVVAVASYVMIGTLSPQSARLASRLATIRAQSVVTRRPELAQPFLERALGPALAKIARWGDSLTPSGQKERMALKLQMAGFYRPVALHSLFAFKGLGVIASALIAGLLFFSAPPIAVVAGGVGLSLSLVAPELVLNRLIQTRQTQILRALPDILDLVTASVEAGLTVDAAIARVSSNPAKPQAALCDELSRYLQEVRLGRSRAEALSELGRRCGVSDLQAVVAALIQADALGVGVGTVLRAQSLFLRTRRKQRAQEAAMKAPVKMLFPLVLFIFPSIFIVTLGPAVLKILDTFIVKH